MSNHLSFVRMIHWQVFTFPDIIPASGVEELTSQTTLETSQPNRLMTHDLPPESSPDAAKKESSLFDTCESECVIGLLHSSTSYYSTIKYRFDLLRNKRSPHHICGSNLLGSCYLFIDLDLS